MGDAHGNHQAKVFDAKLPVGDKADSVSLVSMYSRSMPCDLGEHGNHGEIAA